MVNPKNFPFGTVSICRVPKQFLKDKGEVKSNFSGCLGCATGKSGMKNIFGNKYGQSLAKIQILREKRDSMNVQPQPEEDTSVPVAVEGGTKDTGDDSGAAEGKTAKDAWYDEKEEIEYSDGSSTEDDEEVDTNASNKRKIDAGSTTVTAAEAEATIELIKKQKQG